jgi:hypothetical protein
VTASFGQPLHAVVCSYDIDPARLAQSLSSIGRRLRTRFVGVIVCNAQHALPDQTADWQFLRGSNSELDFSAYHEGAEHLQAGTAPPCVLFLNDSTFSRHNAQHVIKSLLAYRSAVEDAAVSAMAGKTDTYDSICYSSPWSQLPVFVSSFCFLLNQRALSALPAVRLAADHDLRSTDMDVRSPAWGVHLPAAFRHFLKAHLAYPGTSMAWYQLQRKRGQTELLMKKLRCVYSEHRLSGEVGRDGIVFSVYPTARLKARFFVFEQLAKLQRKLGLSP